MALNNKTQYFFQICPSFEIFQKIEYMQALGKLNTDIFSYNTYAGDQDAITSKFYRGMFLIDGENITSSNADFVVTNYKGHIVLIASVDNSNPNDMKTIRINGNGITRVLGVCF